MAEVSAISTLEATPTKTCKQWVTSRESKTSIRISILRLQGSNMVTLGPTATRLQQVRFRLPPRGNTLSRRNRFRRMRRSEGRALAIGLTRMARLREDRKLGESTLMANLQTRRARRQTERGRSRGRSEARTTWPPSTLLQWTGSVSEYTSTSRSRCSMFSKTSSQTIKGTS